MTVTSDAGTPDANHGSSDALVRQRLDTQPAGTLDTTAQTTDTTADMTDTAAGVLGRQGTRGEGAEEELAAYAADLEADAA